ncbi:N-acetylglutamate synthase-like GNAT family acetyltransferase [Sinobacterium caligoides]|uniref:N-acetylglutamate synthase-like GNAT family acetyltransferase n=1 Tax=Sinobacterium caligoides TaxID=933926 RepID=A0A3N2D535_9GAMM|nr:GNAT family N-acetyltransferase [Sinobacterium caligoides]ROR94887.1 N-acetylglutamate synthase-like GNAT family acetyltransferase [Sinobacterium caligoides]
MEVLENQKEFLDDFIHLNEEWITTYFELEAADHALAENPFKIIEDGGYIFSLASNDRVHGVCSLFYEEDGVFELARMAVSPYSQGKGYGNKLIEAALSKLSEIGAKRVYLVSNTKLKPAIELYKKYGFNTIFEGQHPMYSRANIVMSRNVS